MTWCVAVGCTNNKKNNPNLSFYKLPSNNKAVSEEWKAKIKRENLPKIVRLCEKHFEENCFDPHVDLKIVCFQQVSNLICFGRFTDVVVLIKILDNIIR